MMQLSRCLMTQSQGANRRIRKKRICVVTPPYILSCTSFVPVKAPEQAVFCNHLKSNIEIKNSQMLVYIYQSSLDAAHPNQFVIGEQMANKCD